MEKAIMTQYFIRVKYKCRPVEYHNLHSKMKEGDFIRMLYESADTPEERAKGLFIESVCPATEMEYVQYSLTEKINFHKFQFPN